MEKLTKLEQEEIRVLCKVILISGIYSESVDINVYCFEDASIECSVFSLDKQQGKFIKFNLEESFFDTEIVSRENFNYLKSQLEYLTE